MTYEDIIKQVSQELEMSYDVVDKTYKGFWSFIRNQITNLPLKENLSKEDFDKLRTNFNIPSLGKLSCTYGRYTGMKQRMQYINKYRQEEQQNGNKSKED